MCVVVPFLFVVLFVAFLHGEVVLSPVCCDAVSLPPEELYHAVVLQELEVAQPAVQIAATATKKDTTVVRLERLNNNKTTQRKLHQGWSCGWSWGWSWGWSCGCCFCLCFCCCYHHVVYINSLSFDSVCVYVHLYVVRVLSELSAAAPQLTRVSSLVCLTRDARLLAHHSLHVMRRVRSVHEDHAIPGAHVCLGVALRETGDRSEVVGRTRAGLVVATHTTTRTVTNNAVLVQATILNT